jgi:hypothetical protein
MQAHVELPMFRTEESVELVCSSQNRVTFAHHFQKEEIPSRVLLLEYQKIEYIGRVSGRIPAIIGQYLP